VGRIARADIAFGVFSARLYGSRLGKNQKLLNGVRQTMETVQR